MTRKEKVELLRARTIAARRAGPPAGMAGKRPAWVEDIVPWLFGLGFALWSQYENAQPHEEFRWVFGVLEK